MHRYSRPNRCQHHQHGSCLTWSRCGGIGGFSSAGKDWTTVTTSIDDDPNAATLFDPKITNTTMHVLNIVDEGSLSRVCTSSADIAQWFSACLPDISHKVPGAQRCCGILRAITFDLKW